jgi:hypothetical protein
MKDPEYEIEIVGYEKDDPSLTADIDEKEIRTWKSIDDKRLEKGKEPYDKPWSKIPLNPYVIQLLNQDQAGPFGGSMEEMGEDEEFGEEGNGEEEEKEEGEENGNGPGWDEMEEDRKGGEDVEKSLNRRRFVRIVV